MSEVRNAPSPYVETSLKNLGEFLGLDVIEFAEVNNGEALTLVKGGKQFVINACGNRFDGSFFGYGHGKVEDTAPATPTPSAPSHLDIEAAADLDKLLPLG